MFTIHKDLPYGVWFHQPEAMREKATKPKAVTDPEETESEQDQELLLKPEDYQVYINPKLKAETEVNMVR